MTTTTKPRSIFLSYSHAESDRPWIAQFRESLAARGLAVWSDDETVPSGDSAVDAVEARLRGADTLVALVGSTPDANLFFEIGAALALGKHVVAIVPNGVDASQLLKPLRFRTQLVKESPEDTARALVA